MTSNPLQTETARNAKGWRKSSRSQNSGGSCVEVVSLSDSIAIRDSKLNTIDDHPVLTIPISDWNSLLLTVTA